MKPRSQKKSQNQSFHDGDSKPSPTDIDQRFAAAAPKLNARRQRLVRAILDSSDETCFLSSREMAKRYHVDATTILRTTQVLGYKSFAEFTADLRRHFVSRITPYTVLKAATREKRSVKDHIDHTLDKALGDLEIVKTGLDRQRIIELAKLIKRSRHIVIVGLDFASSLSYYLAYGLLAMGFDAEAPIGGSGNLQYKVEVLTPKDLLVAISFGQCLRDTVESVIRAKKQGVPTFGITDSKTSPIARYCDSYVIAPVLGLSFVTSYVAPTAVISAIHVACAHIDPKRALQRLRPTDKEYTTGARWYREPKGTNEDLP